MAIEFDENGIPFEVPTAVEEATELPLELEFLLNSELQAPEQDLSQFPRPLQQAAAEDEFLQLFGGTPEEVVDTGSQLVSQGVEAFQGLVPQPPAVEEAPALVEVVSEQPVVESQPSPVATQPQSLDALGLTIASTNQAKQAAQDAAQARKDAAQVASEQAQAESEYDAETARQQQEILSKATTRFQEERQAIQDRLEAIETQRVRPKGVSTGQAIGIALSGLSRDPRYLQATLKLINDGIERDLQSQMEERKTALQSLQRQAGLSADELTTQRQLAEDLEQARLMARAEVANEFRNRSLEAFGAEQDAGTQALQAQLNQGVIEQLQTVEQRAFKATQAEADRELRDNLARRQIGAANFRQARELEFRRQQANQAAQVELAKEAAKGQEPSFKLEDTVTAGPGVSIKGPDGKATDFAVVGTKAERAALNKLIPDANKYHFALTDMLQEISSDTGWLDLSPSEREAKFAKMSAIILSSGESLGRMTDKDIEFVKSAIGGSGANSIFSMRRDQAVRTLRNMVTQHSIEVNDRLDQFEIGSEQAGRTGTRSQQLQWSPPRVAEGFGEEESAAPEIQGQSIEGEQPFRTVTDGPAESFNADVTKLKSSLQNVKDFKDIAELRKGTSLLKETLGQQEGPFQDIQLREDSPSVAGITGGGRTGSQAVEELDKLIGYQVEILTFKDRLKNASLAERARMAGEAEELRSRIFADLGPGGLDALNTAGLPLR